MRGSLEPWGGPWNLACLVGGGGPWLRKKEDEKWRTPELSCCAGEGVLENKHTDYVTLTLSRLSPKALEARKFFLVSVICFCLSCCSSLSLSLPLSPSPSLPLSLSPSLSPSPSLPLPVCVHGTRLLPGPCVFWHRGGGDVGRRGNNNENTIKSRLHRPSASGIEEKQKRVWLWKM